VIIWNSGYRIDNTEYRSQDGSCGFWFTAEHAEHIDKYLATTIGLWIDASLLANWFGYYGSFFKNLAMILPSLYIGPTKKMGRGIFTARSLKMGTVVEIAPVIVMENSDREWLDKTLLHDYIFEWGGKKKQCCMALGWVPLYNHSYKSNCEYEMDYKKQLIQIITVRSIKKGEELFINYNGEWNNEEKVWFESR
jgi:hypothetical protein